MFFFFWIGENNFFDLFVIVKFYKEVWVFIGKNIGVFGVGCYWIFILFYFGYVIVVIWIMIVIFFIIRVVIFSGVNFVIGYFIVIK